MVQNYIEFSSPLVLSIEGRDGQLRTLSLTSLDPAKNTWAKNDLWTWRQALKLALFGQRKGRSDLSGKPLTTATGCHMHEGILTRANVPKGIAWSYLIYSPVNCFLLSIDEHIPFPPPRQWAVERAVRRYGYIVVEDWWESLPFKSRPFQLWN